MRERNLRYIVAIKKYKGGKMAYKIAIIILFFALISSLAILQANAQMLPDKDPSYKDNEKEINDENIHWSRMIVCSKANATKAGDDECLKCHQNILEKKTYSKDNPPVVRIHYFHLKESGQKFTCSSCHEKMDPFNESGASLRKQVNPFICYTCHEPFNKSE